MAGIVPIKGTTSAAVSDAGDRVGSFASRLCTAGSGASVGVGDNGQLRDRDWPLETEYFAKHWGKRGWLYRWREEAKRFRLIGSYRPQSCDAILPSIPPSELKPMSLWPRGGLVPF